MVSPNKRKKKTSLICCHSWLTLADQNLFSWQEYISFPTTPIDKTIHNSEYIWNKLDHYYQLKYVLTNYIIFSQPFSESNLWFLFRKTLKSISLLFWNHFCLSRICVYFINAFIYWWNVSVFNQQSLGSDVTKYLSRDWWSKQGKIELNYFFQTLW